jgi:alpha-tubulin suppressor-like RCC1 family protein
MIHRIVLVGSVVATVAACGDDSTGPGILVPVASIAISSIPDPLLTRQTLRLEAATLDARGTALPDRPVSWTSNDPTLLSISAGGVLTALSPGTATVIAAVDGVADTATVTVRALQLEHIYAGSSLSCGLEPSGEAWCWGNVGLEGYGNGSIDATLRHVPARAAVGHTFVTLAFTRNSACGVELAGTVVCWGKNDRGQVGDGTTVERGAPIPVAGLGTIAQLAAGDAHVCARSVGGAVSCWGDNEWLQAGRTIRGIVDRPALVPLVGPADEIAAGTQHSCARVAAQDFCWGADNSGQLGNDTTYHRLVPVLATTGDGTSRTWSEVDASNYHTCGRDSGEAMFCWGVLEGPNDHDTVAWLPTRRLESISAIDIAGGWFVQCAVSTQQRAWCEGHKYPPVELATSGDVTSVVAAGSEACALLVGGTVECELAEGPRGEVKTIPLPAPAVMLSASDREFCALDTDAAVHCWFLWTEETQPQRKFEALTVTGVFANSGGRTCVVAQGGTVSCRDSFDDTESIEATGGATLISLAVGDNHTCGLTAAGAAWCWGTNSQGQLGDGTQVDRETAVAVQGGHVFARLAVGYEHSCGLTTAGAIYCWGHGSYGSMGDDNRDESGDPVSVDGTPPLIRIGAGPWTGCGLDGSGAAWCWPLSFFERGLRQVPGAAGLVSTTGPCGLRSTGEMLCWGDNFSGWFGDGTYNRATASAVAAGNGLRFAEVSFSLGGTACGITLDGESYCWGNGFGTSLGSPADNGEVATIPVKLYGSP